MDTTNGYARSPLSQFLTTHQPELLEAIVEEQYARQPELAIRYGEAGRTRCREDAGYHLAYLSQAAAISNPTLFGDYFGWVKVVLDRRNIPTADLEVALHVMQDVLSARLSAELHETLHVYIVAGHYQLLAEAVEIDSFLTDEGELALLAHQYLQALLRMERHTASQLIINAVQSGTSVEDVYLAILQPVQYELGRLWQMNAISVAQEHYCTAATQLIMSQLYPYIFSGKPDKGSMVATCVGSELHEVGVRMVADLFELAGWDTVYLGANLPLPALLQTLVARQPAILCLSVTMAYHLPRAQEVLQAVRAHPDLQQVKILVGGYPFRQIPDLWQQIGADGYGMDAREALAVALRLSGATNIR